ncbi:MAG: hypothetical protein AABX03_00495 [Nanoarchaeota archaeon]
MVSNIANSVSNGLNLALTSFKEVIPNALHPYFNLAFFIVAITLYCLFVWKFNKFLSRRDIIGLNLHKYNKVEHPLLNKTLALVLFLLEYMVILPILVFFWFLIIGLMILLLAKDFKVDQIAIMSACIVGVIRIISYYNQQLSEDIGKQFPLALLVILLTSTSFFDIKITIEKIASIPAFFNSIAIYLLFIILIEFIMRIIYIFRNINKIDR